MRPSSAIRTQWIYVSNKEKDSLRLHFKLGMSYYYSHDYSDHYSMV